MKSKSLILGALLAAALAVSACNKGGGEETEPATQEPTAQAQAAEKTLPPEVIAEAETIFGTRCMPCHGPNGEGDGPASKGLTPPPRNFTDATWQASVTDEHITTIIKLGGAAVQKSPMMPPNPDLIAKEDVVAALVKHVRGLKGKGSAPATATTSDTTQQP